MRRRKKRFKKLRHNIAFIVIATLIFVSKKMPRFIGLRLFGFLALLFSFIFKKERKITCRNLKKVFVDLSDKEIEKIVNGVFVNAGKSMFDSIKLPELSPKKFFKIVRWDDENLAREILTCPNGSVGLSNHLSAFELQTHTVAKFGYKPMGIGTKIINAKVYELFKKLRRRNGVLYFDRNGGIMDVFRNLKKGYIFGALVDQDATNEGVFVNFLGEEAFTPYIPVKVAIKCKIPLVWAFLIREKGDKYVFYWEKAEIIEGETEWETYILTLEKYNERLGEYVKKYPEQWVWMHDRWTRKPENYKSEISISHYKKGEQI